MQIERSQGEVLIRFSDTININADYLQRFTDYIRFMETAAKSNATEKDIENIAEDINQSWWVKNKDKFIK